MEPAQADQLGQKQPIQWGAEPNTMVVRDKDGIEHIIKLPKSVQCGAPNTMGYKDDKGVRRTIYVPQGDMHAAWDHWQNKRWDELTKFAPYTNQK